MSTGVIQYDKTDSEIYISAYNILEMIKKASNNLELEDFNKLYHIIKLRSLLK